MFSQSTEYAIRASIEIATRPEGEHVLASELGESLEIPTYYLSKILHQLVRARVLKSVRGRRGGFALAKPAEKVKLKEIAAPFEDLQKYEECILGQSVCSEAGACPLHDFWGSVRDRFLDELNTKTLKELSEFQLKRLSTMSGSMRSKLKNAPGMKTVTSGKTDKGK
jgi:Rrf2 family protein